MRRKKRILAIASGGGHWVQLLRLRPAFQGHDITFVTTLQGLQDTVSDARVIVVADASRDNFLKLSTLLVQLLLIIIRIRPHVLVTTGAAPGVIAIRLAKVLGARTLWLDSIANAEELSLSGKMALGHADLCLSQWPHVANQNAGVEYRGAVI